MRKVVVFICGACLVLATTVSAGPLDKGSSLIGGQISFMSQGGKLYEDNEDNALTTLTVTPYYGHFFSPGLMIGGQVSMTALSQGDDEFTQWTAGPRVTYYFGAQSDRESIRGAVYPHLGVLFNFGKIDFGGDNSIDVTEFGGTGGVLFMMSDAVGADFVVVVSSDKWSDGGDSEKGTTMTFGVGISAFLY